MKIQLTQDLLGSGLIIVGIMKMTCQYDNVSVLMHVNIMIITQFWVCVIIAANAIVHGVYSIPMHINYSWHFQVRSRKCVFWECAWLCTPLFGYFD